MLDNQTETIAAEAKNLPRPAIFIKIDDQRSVKMTYGLLMDLQRLLPDASQAMALVLGDPYTQDYVIRRIMTDKKGTVTKDEDLIQAEELDLDPEQMERILDWAVQHILHFFAQRAGNMASLGMQFQTALPGLFTDGSPTSASTTPSAGPSTEPKESSTDSSGPTAS